MSFSPPQLRIGEPVHYEALSVFPLFTESNGTIDYRLSHEAIEDKTLVVQEVSGGGSVPELLVENKGDRHVLFLEGDHLVGAKQDRILNTSVLIGAKTKTTIPVSCVEAGRWHYRRRDFAPGISPSPPVLRRVLKESVSKSLKKKEGYRSDQGQVWEGVHYLLACHGVVSSTDAMEDLFAQHREQIAKWQEAVACVEGACGMAVAIGNKITSIDVFDKPETCAKVWPRIMPSFSFDAMTTQQKGQVSPEDVDRALNRLRELPWEPVQEKVGLGEEFRADSDDDYASALTFDGKVIHLSWIAPV